MTESTWASSLISPLLLKVYFARSTHSTISHVTWLVVECVERAK